MSNSVSVHYLLKPGEQPVKIIEGEIIPVHQGMLLEATGDLAIVESKILALISEGEALMFQIAKLVRLIDEQALYKQAINSKTGKPFRTMGEYYPSLILLLKQQGKLNKLSESTVRNWVRINELFVEALEVPAETILEIGSSHFLELAEAIDYKSTTTPEGKHVKVVAEEPKPGKLGKAEALEVIQELIEAPNTPQATRQLLSAQRGVEMRAVECKFGPTSEGKVMLRDLIIWRDGTAERPAEGISVDLARWLVKRLSAQTNLPEEFGD